VTKIKTKGSGSGSTTRKKVEVEVQTNVHSVQTARRTTRTRSAIKQEDAVTLQPVQDGRIRGGLKRKRLTTPPTTPPTTSTETETEMDIELQSARYYHHTHHQDQHDAVKSEAEDQVVQGSGCGSGTELDDDDNDDDEESGGGEKGGEGNEDEDITIDEDDNKTISGDDGEAEEGPARKTVSKVKETKVGLWKGYLRLSKVSLLYLIIPLFVPSPLSASSSLFTNLPLL
jgi:hypothetical protein